MDPRGDGLGRAAIQAGILHLRSEEFLVNHALKRGPARSIGNRLQWVVIQQGFEANCRVPVAQQDGVGIDHGHHAIDGLRGQDWRSHQARRNNKDQAENQEACSHQKVCPMLKKMFNRRIVSICGAIVLFAPVEFRIGNMAGFKL